MYNDNFELWERCRERTNMLRTQSFRFPISSLVLVKMQLFILRLLPEICFKFFIFFTLLGSFACISPQCFSNMKWRVSMSTGSDCHLCYDELCFALKWLSRSTRRQIILKSLWALNRRHGGYSFIALNRRHGGYSFRALNRRHGGYSFRALNRRHGGYSFRALNRRYGDEIQLKGP